jgi:hypothetical protein
MRKIFLYISALMILTSCAELDSTVTGYYKELKTSHILTQQKKAQLIRDEICNMPWFIIQDDPSWAAVIEIKCMGLSPVSSKDLLNIMKGAMK